MDSYLKERIISGKSFEKCDFTSLLGRCTLSLPSSLCKCLKNVRWLSESVQSDGSTSRDLLKPLYYAEKDFKFPSRIWTYLPLYHDSETSVPKMMTEEVGGMASIPSFEVSE